MLWKERFTYRDASGRRHLQPFARIGLLILVVLGVLFVTALSARVYMLTRPVPTPVLPAVVQPPTFQPPTPSSSGPPTVVLTRPQLMGRTMMRAAGDGWAVGPKGIYRQVEGQWQQVDVGITPLSVSAALQEGGRLWVAYATMYTTVQDKTVIFFPPKEGAKTGILVLDARSGEVLEKRAVPSQPWDLALWRGDVYANTNMGVYRLSDNRKIGPPREVPYYLGYSLLATNDALYTGMWDGVWRWDGTIWTHVLPLQREKVVDMTKGGGYIYAGVSEGGVYRSPDGITWQRILRTRTPYLLLQGERLYAGGYEVVVWDTVRKQILRRYSLYALGMSSPKEGEVWITTPEGTYVLKEHP